MWSVCSQREEEWILVPTGSIGGGQQKILKTGERRNWQLGVLIMGLAFGKAHFKHFALFDTK